MKGIAKGILAIGLLAAFCATTSVQTASAGYRGAPQYIPVAQNVMYSKDKAMNSALVVMDKAHGREFYDMIFYKDFFVVTHADCFTNKDVHSRLQNEVGVRQYYEDNPKTAAVKDDMFTRGYLDFSGAKGVLGSKFDEIVSVYGKTKSSEDGLSYGDKSISFFFLDRDHSYCSSTSVPGKSIWDKNNFVYRMLPPDAVEVKGEICKHCQNGYGEASVQRRYYSKQLAEIIPSEYGCNDHNIIMWEDSYPSKISGIIWNFDWEKVRENEAQILERLRRLNK